MHLTEEQLSLLHRFLFRLWILTDEYNGNCEGDLIFHFLDCSVAELPQLEKLCLELGLIGLNRRHDDLEDDEEEDE